MQILPQGHRVKHNRWGRICICHMWKDAPTPFASSVFYILRRMRQLEVSWEPCICPHLFGNPTRSSRKKINRVLYHFQKKLVYPQASGTSLPSSFNFSKVLYFTFMQLRIFVSVLPPFPVLWVSEIVSYILPCPPFFPKHMFARKLSLWACSLEHCFQRQLS